MPGTDEIFLDNDHYVRVGPLKRKRLDTGAEELATGIAVESFIALTKAVGATPIHSTLDLDLVEQGAGTAIYAGTFDGAAITTHLAAHVGRNVYRITRSGQDYRTAQPLRVVDPRLPEIP